MYDIQFTWSGKDYIVEALTALGEKGVKRMRERAEADKSRNDQPPFRIVNDTVLTSGPALSYAIIYAAGNIAIINRPSK